MNTFLLTFQAVNLYNSAPSENVKIGDDVTGHWPHPLPGPPSQMGTGSGSCLERGAWDRQPHVPSISQSTL